MTLNVLMLIGFANHGFFNSFHCVPLSYLSKFKSFLAFNRNYKNFTLFFHMREAVSCLVHYQYNIYVNLGKNQIFTIFSLINIKILFMVHYYMQ